jgi:myo-inositol-1(or 4)-monophosphatase
MNTPVILPEVLFEGRDLKATEEFVRTLVADVATKILSLRSGGSMKMEEKRDGTNNDGKKYDLVTEADRLSEQLIVTAIRERFPSDAINGEEEGNQGAKESDWKWDIDPIDGTYNFSRGDESGISVGLLYKGDPVLGVIQFLHDNSQMYAAKGHGAFLYNCASQEEKTLNIHNQTPSPTVLALTHLTWDIGHGDLHEQMSVFTTLRPHTRYMTSHACYPISVRRVLANNRDAYVNTGAKSYDMAASIAIALEAGAVVSGIKEDVLNLNQDGVIPSIIARNSEILMQIRKALGHV